jgi:VCBS repeat-containing protein
MAILTVGPFPNTYQTLGAAMAAAEPYDTIVLSAGYSDETVIVSVDNLTIDGGAGSSRINLQLEPGVVGLNLTGDAPINVFDSSSGDTITGNAGDNVITVSGGIDVVDGGSGVDRLVVDYSAATGAVVGTSATSFTAAGVGSVGITGGFEHYTIMAGSGINTITTGGGDDIITNAGDGANTIVAGEGNNQIITGAGIENINTGSGNDTILAGEGASTITTTGGDNHIETGAGIDTIVVGNGADVILGGAGANTITGLAGDKIIVTGDDIDTITVTSGNNTIIAGAGANTIAATSGNNVICTGDDIDTITVTGGDNVIKAGDGANTITATSGHNVIFGGADVDTIVATTGGNYIDGGDGANTLTTGGGNDTIVSGVDVDTIATGGGDDLILITGGADVIAGATGNDTLVVDYSAATIGVITSVPAGTAATGYAGTLSGMGAATYSGIENFDITSGSGNDALTTGAGDDIINSGTGNDVVNAGAGDDYIYGNAGDVIDGGDGGDTLNLGLGLTSLNHTIAYDEDNDQNGVVTYTDTGETLTFTNIENVIYEAPLDPTVEIRVPDPDMCDPFADGAPPVANPDTAEVDEDASVIIDVLGNDTDPNGDPLTVTGATAPNGTVVINGDGTLTFTPDADFNGEVYITYTIEDPDGNEATGTATVAVLPVNDAPVAADDVASTPEDTLVTINVLGNDTDVDGDLLTVTVATAANGTVVINPDGTLDYTPNPDFNGDDTITYTVSDGNGGTSTADVAVTVTEGPPAANHGTVTEDGTDVNCDVVPGTPDATGTLTSTGLDAGATATWTGSGAGTYGSFAIDPDTGDWAYTLDNDLPTTESLASGIHAIETFTITVTDEFGATAMQDVTIRVNGSDDGDCDDIDVTEDIWLHGVPCDDETNQLIDTEWRYHGGSDKLKLSLKIPIEAFFGDDSTYIFEDVNIQPYLDAFNALGITVSSDDISVRVNDDILRIKIVGRDMELTPAQIAALPTMFETQVSVSENGNIRQLNICTGIDETKVYSPIVFDLNESDAIEVTGNSTAKVRVDPSINPTVYFDLDADGTLERIEWLAGSGDGFLIDNRDGNAAQNMDGSRLFGDQGGLFANGYEKLATLDANNDGELTEDELEGLSFWVDDGDAVVEDGEIQSLDDYGIDSISVQVREVFNAAGESLLQTQAVVTPGVHIGRIGVAAIISDVSVNNDGTEGNDVMAGSNQDDNLSGGDGHDTLVGGDGADNLQGDGGEDQVLDGSGADLIDTGDEDDIILLNGSTEYADGFVALNISSDSQSGTQVRANIEGLVRIEAVTDGGADMDTIQLSSRGDAFFLHDAISGFHSDVVLTVDAAGNESAARFTNIEVIFGMRGDDLIDLTSADYSLAGVTITIDGGRGDDTIWGSDADETIIGGRDDDVLFGGAGTNILEGGRGDDVFEFTRSSTADTVTDFDANDDILRFYNTDDAEFDISTLALTANGMSIFFNDTDDGTSHEIEIALALTPAEFDVTLPDLFNAIEIF